MKKVLFKGCGTAISTPFNNEGINYEEFGKLIEFQIQNGCDGLIVCGTTGESSTMTKDEKKSVIKFAVEKVNKRIPVIAGTGGNNTLDVIEMSKFSENVGVDGLLIVTPYYNKTTQEGLIEHYKVISSNTSLPIILYSVPSRTGLNIEPSTCLELSKIENIVAIKEASGNLSQVAKIKALCGDNLEIYSGNDDQILPILSLGGIGVISVLSNIFPQYTHNMIQNYFDGKTALATEMQIKCIDLVSSLFCEVNPIPIKEALNMMGYNYGIPRLPLIKMTDKGKEKLKKSIENFKLISGDFND